jgi:hypothetical protein
MVKYRMFAPLVLAVSGLLSLPISVAAQTANAATTTSVVATTPGALPTPPVMQPNVREWCC